MIKSICIVRLSALGDVLMLVPLVRTLQANCPGVSITWVISRPAYDLVEGLDGVEFILIQKPNNIIDYWRFKQQMNLHTFDVLLAAQASFRANLLYPLIKAKRKIGYDKIRAKDGHGWFINEQIQAGKDHTLDGFLRFSDALGCNEKHIKWDLPIRDTHHKWAKAHLPANPQGPVLLINPAASKPERSWLVERYVAVIRYAQSKWNAHVILIGGPGAYDKTLANAIMQHVNVESLVGLTKPKQLLAVIKHADLVICPDTGPSHMSAAVATPVIALHAVTSASVSGPYTFRYLAVDEYPTAIKTVLKKTEKTNQWGTHAHGEDTMRLISVESVIQRIDSVFSVIDKSYHPPASFTVN